jgi:hypothetical protein
MWNCGQDEDNAVWLLKLSAFAHDLLHHHDMKITYYFYFTLHLMLLLIHEWNNYKQNVYIWIYLNFYFSYYSLDSFFQIFCRWWNLEIWCSYQTHFLVDFLEFLCSSLIHILSWIVHRHHALSNPHQVESLIWYSLVQAHHLVHFHRLSTLKDKHWLHFFPQVNRENMMLQIGGKIAK